VPPLGLVVLLLQESHFYHGTTAEAFWTNVFLRLRRVPVKRLRNKSTGLCSIKPATARHLLARRRWRAGQPHKAQSSDRE